MSEGKHSVGQDSLATDAVIPEPGDEPQMTGAFQVHRALLGQLQRLPQLLLSAWRSQMPGREGPMAHALWAFFAREGTA